MPAGAIDIKTNKYVVPKDGKKNGEYKCGDPKCGSRVYFRKAHIRKGVIHVSACFSHPPLNVPCNFYDTNNESYMHVETKHKVLELLQQHKCIYKIKICNCCEKKIKELFLGEEHYNNNTEATLEHNFKFNNSRKTADIALINTKNNKIIAIIEVCHSNKTEETDRPEDVPWIEIKTSELEKIVSGEIFDKNGCVNLKCSRDYTCTVCINNFKEREIIKENERICSLKKARDEKARREAAAEAAAAAYAKRIEYEMKQKEKEREKERLEKEREREIENSQKCYRCSKKIHSDCVISKYNEENCDESDFVEYDKEITETSRLYFCTEKCYPLIENWLERGFGKRSFIL